MAPSKLIPAIAGDDDDLALPADLKAYAEKVLKETDKSRADGLKQLRDFIESSEAIDKCYSGRNFLQIFLRSATYRLPKAKDLLTTFLTCKTKYPQWYADLDPTKEAIRKHYTNGCAYRLAEQGTEGGCIVFVNPVALGIKDVDLDNLVKAIVLSSTAHIHAHRECTLKKLTVVVDCTKLTLDYATAIDLNDFITAIFTNFVVLKGLVKTVLLVGVDKFFRKMYDMTKLFLPNSMRKRITFVSSMADVESHGVKRGSLPLEYGGEADRQQLINAMLKEIDEFPKSYLNDIWPQMGVHEATAKKAKSHVPKRISKAVPVLKYFIEKFKNKPEELDEAALKAELSKIPADEDETK